MEIASLYILKVGVVLPSIMSHVIVIDTRKAPHAKGRILIKGKSTKARDVLSIN